MKRLLQFFLEGVLALAPVVLTLYIVGRIVSFLEDVGLRLLPEGLRLPGLGLLITVALITAFGYLAGTWVLRRLIRAGEELLVRIPIVRTVFGSIKDIVDAFGGKKQSFSKVALVRVPDLPVELLGFVTSEDLGWLGGAGRDKVAVYIPQSLQLGGFVVVVPREHVTVVDVPAPQALKFMVTAGMTAGGDGRP